MASTHESPIYDTDSHLVIDPKTRSITNLSGKTVLMQNDHNSERFTFEIPRLVEGHDMSLCNVVEVHYINVESANKSNQSADVYPVTDVHLSSESDDTVLGSWLVSKNATVYAGTLNFIFRFACVDDDTSEVTYQWFTDVYKDLKVSNGIYNTIEAVREDNYDVLFAWKNEVINAAKVYTDDATKKAVEQINTAANSSKSAIDSTTASCIEQLNRTSSSSQSTIENATNDAVKQIDSIKDFSRDMLEETRNMVTGCEERMVAIKFNINFDTGDLEYTSPDYTLLVNDETGNLEYSVNSSASDKDSIDKVVIGGSEPIERNRLWFNTLDEGNNPFYGVVNNVVVGETAPKTSNILWFNTPNESGGSSYGEIDEVSVGPIEPYMRNVLWFKTINN